MGSEFKLTTGIDRLVQLIKERKSISVNQAVKELGVSVALIEEWANFLEEEGIIDFDYRLSGTLLVEREITEKDIIKKEKTLEKKKKILSKDIKSNISVIEKHSDGIDNLKDEFDKYMKIIKQDFEHIREDITLLHKLEESHDTLNQEIHDQDFYFKLRIKQIDEKLSKESKKYNTILSDITKKEKEIKLKEKKLIELDKHHQEIWEKLNHVEESARRLSKSITKKDQEIVSEITNITLLKKQIDFLHNEVIEQKHMMDELIKNRSVKEKEIVSVMENIKNKISFQKKDVTKSKQDFRKIENKLSDFMIKKQKLKVELANADMNTKTLQKEMNDVIQDARRLDMLTNSANISKFSKEISKQFKELDQKRNKAKKDYKKLTDLLSLKK
jgi:chromosome segregation ATPase